jgi:hypothetical protein
MNFLDFDYKAYHRLAHGTQSDASPADSDTEAEHPVSSPPSDAREIDAPLQHAPNFERKFREYVAV